MYTNAQKLSATVARWLSPMADQLMEMKLSGLPFLTNLEAKVKSTGWVSQNYSLASELSPVMKPIITSMLEPMIFGMVKELPEDSIPGAVHGIVDAAIANGGLTVLEGRVSFTHKDLRDLKRLLSLNLPLEGSGYEVVEA